MTNINLAERAEWLARYALPHEPVLRHRMSFWRLPTGLEIDDIVQEIYAKLTRIEDVSAIQSPGNYMLTMARNIVLGHIRRGEIVSIKALEDFERFDIADDAPGPEQQVSDRQQLDRLARAVSDLPEPSRSAFLLRVIDGLSHQEIGLRLKMSENAIQKNIARSIKKLADFLGRGGGNAHRQASIDRTSNERKNTRGDEGQ